MSFRASSAQSGSRSGGTLASLLLTAVAIALALGSSTTAIAGDVSPRSGTVPAALQDDMTRQDSDSDGLTDREEIEQYRTNPLHPDSDRDGETDGDEVLRHRSNPLNADTDGDGIVDGDERQFGTDILMADSDEDGLVDGAEIALDADPFSADSDGDAIADGVEVRELGTSPVSIDSDGDGLADGDEVAIYATNPAKADPVQLYTYTPDSPGSRVPTKSASSDGVQPIQVVEVNEQPTVSRVPLMPVTSTPVLQVLD